MYDFIRGKLVKKQATEAVIETQGIGYLLKISLSTSEALPAEGEMVVLKTYLHVREDVLQLYGFIDDKERKLFTGLISISGVGPKLAQTILSGLSADKLIAAIQNSNEDALNNISGVGKKTAQRLIVELKDKLGTFHGTDTDLSDHPASLSDSLEQEALMALMSLGYSRQKAESSILKVHKLEKTVTSEELIKKALQAI